jgi:hypothetical protein
MAVRGNCDRQPQRPRSRRSIYRQACRQLVAAQRNLFVLEKSGCLHKQTRDHSDMCRRLAGKAFSHFSCKYELTVCYLLAGLALEGRSRREFLQHITRFIGGVIFDLQNKTRVRVSCF